MTMSTLEEARVLLTITDRDEAGKHFTEVYPDELIDNLEEYGWIAINRPVHPATGIPYGHDSWTMEVTEEGAKLVKAIELAKRLGEEYRAAFVEEFGEDPVIDQIGDWDATAWGEASIEIANELDLDAAGDWDAYNVGRLAFHSALFATDDVA